MNWRRRTRGAAGRAFINHCITHAWMPAWILIVIESELRMCEFNKSCQSSVGDESPLPEISLSQDTMNLILGAVGMTGGTPDGNVWVFYTL